MPERPVEIPSLLLRAEHSLQDVSGLLAQQDRGEEVRVRKLWNDNMKNIPKAVSYLKTVVLMLSWEETDLHTQPEVKPTLPLVTVLKLTIY
jgi:hypothetical protein